MTCKICKCEPCQCFNIKKARKYGEKECVSCNCKLGLRGGYQGTDLCGPCCTGETETAQGKFVNW